MLNMFWRVETKSQVSGKAFSGANLGTPGVKTLDKPLRVCYQHNLNLPMPLPKDEKKRLVHDLRLYGSLGIEMAASVLIGTLMGYLLDKWLGTRPWILIIGFIFGAAAGFRGLYRAVSREDRDRGKSG